MNTIYLTDLLEELGEILGTTERPGDFYAAGTAEIILPRVEVDGVGTISFPLLPAQAEQLIASAEPSPYGRGEQTLHDPEVRRSWQIEPARVRISGRSWAQTLQQVVDGVATGLGVSGSVQAEFYKLLLYDPGSFFVDHRDTEKSPGMFGTLIIVLSSEYSGGELLVRHRDQEARLELQCPEPSDIAFAAFYADCVHEVLPITSGNRLTLVYNLLRKDGELPKPPEYGPQQDRITTLLSQWVASKASPDSVGPEKLVYLLEHAYTEAELAFANLKGADAAAAAVLAAAAPAAGCDLHLAFLSIQQSGSAEYYGDWRRARWSVPDDDEFEIGEIFDESAELTGWRQLDDSAGHWGTLPCFEEEFFPPTLIEDLEPDEQQFREASGNEGASFERFYRQTALVLWPVSRQLAVINQAGLSSTLPFLERLVQNWVDSGEAQSSSTWQTAHELAGHMIDTWPQRAGSYRASSGEPGMRARMLDCLRRLGDGESIETFVRSISAEGTYDEGDNEALVQALALLSVTNALSAIKRVVVANLEEKRNACAHLLCLCSEASWLDGHLKRMTGTAKTLTASLPGDPQRVPEGASWRYGQDLNADLVRNLLTALVRIDTELATQTADYLLAWPDKYGLDGVVLPALLALYEQPTLKDSGAVQRLYSACMAHLQARIAEPLAPPKDWARAAGVSCQCGDCQKLSQFLADSQEKEWVFKAAEARRSHVTQTIRSNQCDLDLRTLKKGSPHQLVCTKNQASYQRRVHQRELDLKHREMLAG